MQKTPYHADDNRLALSPTEAARRIGIGRTHLYSLIKSGALKTVRLGKRRLITLKAIEECLAAHECLP
jgi:DNA binding domain, excisionase family